MKHLTDALISEAVLVHLSSHLGHRVKGRGLVAAPGAPGAVEAEVLADAVPHVLGGQRDVQRQGEHDQEHDGLHGDRPPGDCDGSRAAGGGGRQRLLRVAALVGSITGCGGELIAADHLLRVLLGHFA